MERSANPFCTRFFEPGKIPYHFPNGVSLEQLLGRLPKSISHTINAERFAIVGPHGSGKSTLLAQLHDCYPHPQSNPEQPPSLIVLHATTSKMQAVQACARSLLAHRVCWIDGYEQLPAWGRWMLGCIMNRKRSVVIVTSHKQPRGFSILWETIVDTEIEQAVLEHLLQRFQKNSIQSLVNSVAWKESRAKHQSNLRESLFDMFDWWRDHGEIGRAHV